MIDRKPSENGQTRGASPKSAVLRSVTWLAPALEALPCAPERRISSAFRSRHMGNVG